MILTEDIFKEFNKIVGYHPTNSHDELMMGILDGIRTNDPTKINEILKIQTYTNESSGNILRSPDKTIRYDIVSKLGEGSYGEVHKVRLEGGGEYAMKVQDISDTTTIPDVVPEILMSTLLSINKATSGSVPKIHSVFLTDSDELIVVMDVLKLAEDLFRTMTDLELFSMFSQIVTILTVLQKNCGFMHRDCKINNIFYKDTPYENYKYSCEDLYIDFPVYKKQFILGDLGLSCMSVFTQAGDRIELNRNIPNLYNKCNNPSGDIKQFLGLLYTFPAYRTVISTKPHFMEFTKNMLVYPTKDLKAEIANMHGVIDENYTDFKNFINSEITQYNNEINRLRSIGDHYSASLLNNDANFRIAKIKDDFQKDLVRSVYTDTSEVEDPCGEPQNIIHILNAFWETYKDTNDINKALVQTYIIYDDCIIRHRLKDSHPI